MTLPELKAALIKKEIQPVYIFTGPEIAIMDIYISKVQEAFKGPLKRIDSLASIFGSLKNAGLTNTNFCYVIRDDKDYTKQEALWEKVNSGLVQGNNILIFLYSNLDKREKFYKANQDSIVEFEKLSVEVLGKYVLKDLHLSVNEAQQLATICDLNYSRILLEIDKIKLLASAKQITHNQALRQLLDDGGIYIPPTSAIFDIVDAFCLRDAVRAQMLCRNYLELGESPIPLLTLLYNNFKQILMVTSCDLSDNIVEKTGLTGWQIKMAKEKSGYYSVEELIENLQILHNADISLKSGKIESALILDYLLVKLI